VASHKRAKGGSVSGFAHTKRGQSLSRKGTVPFLYTMPAQPSNGFLSTNPSPGDINKFQVNRFTLVKNEFILIVKNLSMNRGALKMRASSSKESFFIFLIFILFIPLLKVEGIFSEKKDPSSLRSLLPEVELWKFTEAPMNYLPPTLFEYIDGAADIYLAYDFKELIVGQYKKGDKNQSLTVEIYDMGDEKNAFGIYSAERFPDNKFISIGNQGYLEEGALNFIAGTYYAKLLCFDCGEESSKILKLFSQKIVERIKDKGYLPHLLRFFPKEGLVPNSEKFILRDFLGYSFLHDGYTANYQLKGLDFDCFLAEGKNEEDAQKMLAEYLKTRNKAEIREAADGYRFKDRYYHNIYLARVKNYLCGVMRIKEGLEEIGDRYFRMLAESLKRD
jgi:hypothetical protein